MKRMIRYTKVMICGLFFVLTSSALASEYVSPVALAYDGGDNLYIANKTGMQIQRFGMFAKEIKQVFDLPISPEGLAISQGKLYVTGGGQFRCCFYRRYRKQFSGSNSCGAYTDVTDIEGSDAICLQSFQ